MNDQKNIKMIIGAVVVLLVAIYRLGSPYLERTKEIEGEIEKLNKAILAVRQEAAMYGKGWEDTTTKRENEVQARFPDVLKSNEILAYFLTKFEETHLGKVWFDAVNYQRASLSDFKSGTGAKALRTRSVRYKIKAELAQEKVLPYIDHIEKYPGIFRIDTYVFTSSKSRAGALEMDMTLDFYLTPKEWVPPGALVADMEPEEEGGQTKVWRSLFVSSAGSSRKPALETPTRYPHIEKIVGTSIVVEENLYEEGDVVAGWRIFKVDSRAKKVVLKKGSITKEVSVK